jgi:hypothetical protein
MLRNYAVYSSLRGTYEWIIGGARWYYRMCDTVPRRDTVLAGDMEKIDRWKMRSLDGERVGNLRRGSLGITTCDWRDVRFGEFLEGLPSICVYQSR